MGVSTKTFVISYPFFLLLFMEHSGSVSGRVLDSRSRGYGFEPHPEALHYVLVQENLSSA